MVIFTGYFKPYQKKMVNILELINDSIIVVCSYFLIMFSDLVPDPETKYIMGWPLIALISTLILMNITVIVFKGIQSIVRKCRLYARRRRNRKLARKRILERRKQLE